MGGGGANIKQQKTKKNRFNCLRDCILKVSSRINHSCSPNAYINDKFEIVSLRQISKNEEITISYFDNDEKLYLSQNHRKTYLRKKREFDCQCIRCNNTDDVRIFLCQSVKLYSLQSLFFLLPCENRGKNTHTHKKSCANIFCQNRKRNNQPSQKKTV